MRIFYKIEFFTFWHAGSGLSGGTAANAQVIKDEYELPFIPGRTLKGLLRQSARQINALHADEVTETFIESVFGIGEDQIKEKNVPLEESKTLKQGQCFFSNATLSQYIINELKGKEEQKSLLFTTLASTAIDEKGLAKDQTLRQIEVAIPLTLFAAIEGFPNDPNYLAQLEKCFHWIKKMGVNRSRGLGRCKFSLYQPDQSASI